MVVIDTLAIQQRKFFLIDMRSGEVENILGAMVKFRSECTMATPQACSNSSDQEQSSLGYLLRPKPKNG